MATTVAPQLDPLLAALQTVLKRSGKLVPGYYAIDDKRYVLQMPLTGKWAGFTFLKTGSDYHLRYTIAMQRPDGEFAPYKTTDQGRLVLAQILEDPVAAMKAYGDITGLCSICGRKLECPISVRFGIGPWCLNKLMASLS